MPQKPTIVNKFAWDAVLQYPSHQNLNIRDGLIYFFCYLFIRLSLLYFVNTVVVKLIRQNKIVGVCRSYIKSWLMFSVPSRISTLIKLYLAYSTTPKIFPKFLTFKPRPIPGDIRYFFWFLLIFLIRGENMAEKNRFFRFWKIQNFGKL